MKDGEPIQILKCLPGIMPPDNQILRMEALNPGDLVNVVDRERHFELFGVHLPHEAAPAYEGKLRRDNAVVPITIIGAAWGQPAIVPGKLAEGMLAVFEVGGKRFYTSEVQLITVYRNYYNNEGTLRV